MRTVFYTGTSSASVLLMKYVTLPITSTSSAANPSIASPSSVINALPLSFANCVRPPDRISRVYPCTSRAHGSITANPDDVSRMRLSFVVQMLAGDKRCST